MDLNRDVLLIHKGGITLFHISREPKNTHCDNYILIIYIIYKYNYTRTQTREENKIVSMVIIWTLCECTHTQKHTGHDMQGHRKSLHNDTSPTSSQKSLSTINMSIIVMRSYSGNQEILTILIRFLST